MVSMIKRNQYFIEEFQKLVNIFSLYIARSGLNSNKDSSVAIQIHSQKYTKGNYVIMHEF